MASPSNWIVWCVENSDSGLELIKINETLFEIIFKRCDETRHAYFDTFAEIG